MDSDEGMFRRNEELGEQPAIPDEMLNDDMFEKYRAGSFILEWSFFDELFFNSFIY